MNIITRNKPDLILIWIQKAKLLKYFLANQRRLFYILLTFILQVPFQTTPILYLFKATSIASWMIFRKCVLYGSVKVWIIHIWQRFKINFVRYECKLSIHFFLSYVFIFNFSLSFFFGGGGCSLKICIFFMTSFIPVNVILHFISKHSTQANVPVFDLCITKKINKDFNITLLRYIIPLN